MVLKRLKGVTFQLVVSVLLFLVLGILIGFSGEKLTKSLVSAETIKSKFPQIIQPVIRIDIQPLKVAATVNQDQISADYLKFAARLQGGTQTDYNKLLDSAIDTSLLSQAAAKTGLTETPAVKTGVRRAQKHFSLTYVMNAEKYKTDEKNRQLRMLSYLQDLTKDKQISTPQMNYDELFINGPLAEDQKNNLTVASLDTVKISLGDVFDDLGPYGEAIFVAADSSLKRDLIIRSLQLKLVDNKFVQTSAAEKNVVNEVLNRIKQTVEARAYSYLIQGQDYQAGINSDQLVSKKVDTSPSTVEIKTFYEANPKLFTEGDKKLTLDNPKVMLLAEQNIRLGKEKTILENELKTLHDTSNIKKFSEVLTELQGGAKQ
jgi:hypothetical protein